MFTLGIYKNALGPTFGAGIVIATVFLLTDRTGFMKRTGLFVALALTCIGIVVTLSRGAWIATGITLLTGMLWIRGATTKVIGLALLLAIPAALVWQSLGYEATEYATDLSVESYNIRSRLDSIDEAIEAFRRNLWIGVGIGLRKTVEPHNVLVLTLGECGVIGVVAFVSMIACGLWTFRVASISSRDDPRMRPLILAGALVLMVTVLHGMMDVYWRRGIGIMGWASVGMALWIIQYQRRRSLLAAILSKSQEASGDYTQVLAARPGIRNT